MERRRTPRARCAIPCSIVSGRKTIPAVVRNLSEGGLALEAPLAAGETGDTLQLRLEPARRAAVEVAAVVWHIRTGRAGVRPIARYGLVLSEAGEEYFELLAALLPAAAQPASQDPGPAPPPPLQSFSVQVAQAGSPRTRRILVRAAAAGEARLRALEEIGPGWSVVAVVAARRS